MLLYCFYRDFIPYLHKSKGVDNTDIWNVSPYHVNIFTIDNPVFKKHILVIYRPEHLLNKVKTLKNGTFFGFDYEK